MHVVVRDSDVSRVGEAVKAEHRAAGSYIHVLRRGAVREVEKELHLPGGGFSPSMF